jgi:hypothetical protein
MIASWVATRPRFLVVACFSNVTMMSALTSRHRQMDLTDRNAGSELLNPFSYQTELDAPSAYCYDFVACDGPG